MTSVSHDVRIWIKQPIIHPKPLGLSAPLLHPFWLTIKTERAIGLVSLPQELELMSNIQASALE